MTSRSPSSMLGLAGLLLVGACSDDPMLAEPDATTTDVDSEDAERQALFHEDVRPILARHCGSCHVDGAIGPFALDTYQDAVDWAEPMLAAVQERSMPPFAVNNDGSCNTFTDARWLSDEEIDTLERWVADGLPEGDASIAAPPVPAPPTLDGAVEEFALPQYLPEAKPEYGDFEDYHCFAVELGLDAPRFVTGFDVLPGNAEMVHHVLGFRVNPSLLGNAAQMQALDDMSPDVPGWDCFGAAGDGILPASVPVTWAPGSGAVEYPDETGIRFDPGDVLVVQVHYDLVGGAEIDRTRLHLEMSDDVERQAHMTLWDPFLQSAEFGDPIPLPAGQPDAQFSWDAQLLQMLAFDPAGADQYDQIEVLGFIPHMHKRGVRMSIEVQTDAGTQCGADVDRWDFNWQTSYFLEQPISAAMTDRLHVTCEFDTMGDTEPVLPGFGSDDEMCLVGVMFAPT